MDLERDRFVELEVRPAVEGGELLPVQFELDAVITAPGLAAVNLLPFLAVACILPIFEFLKTGRVELRGFLGLVVEPRGNK